MPAFSMLGCFTETLPSIDSLAAAQMFYKCVINGVSPHQSSQASYLVEHSVQLIACLTNTVAIVAVHHEDETLGVLEVMPPQRTDLNRAIARIRAQFG